jgi:hypothetical protein
LAPSARDGEGSAEGRREEKLTGCYFGWTSIRNRYSQICWKSGRPADCLGLDNL